MICPLPHFSLKSKILIQPLYHASLFLIQALYHALSLPLAQSLHLLAAIQFLAATMLPMALLFNETIAVSQSCCLCFPLFPSSSVFFLCLFCFLPPSLCFLYFLCFFSPLSVLFLCLVSFSSVFVSNLPFSPLLCYPQPPALYLILLCSLL